MEFVSTPRGVFRYSVLARGGDNGGVGVLHNCHPWFQSSVRDTRVTAYVDGRNLPPKKLLHSALINDSTMIATSSNDLSSYDAVACFPLSPVGGDYMVQSRALRSYGLSIPDSIYCTNRLSPGRSSHSSRYCRTANIVIERSRVSPLATLASTTISCLGIGAPTTHGEPTEIISPNDSAKKTFIRSPSI
jgi:hypothetical protein